MLHAVRLNYELDSTSTPPIALLVATALVHGASAFVTHDQRLRRLEAFLSIVILDDFAPL